MTVDKIFGVMDFIWLVCSNQLGYQGLFCLRTISREKQWANQSTVFSIQVSANQSTVFNYRPIRVQYSGLGQSEYSIQFSFNQSTVFSIQVSANQSTVFNYRPIRVQYSGLGQSEYSIQFLSNQSTVFRSRPI